MHPPPLHLTATTTTSTSRRGTLGILREVYSKWERRSPLTPDHVARLAPRIQVLVQPSTKRVFTDAEFRAAGAVITDDLSPAQAILGVKQVKPSLLIPDKTYLFFSHTIKAQPANMSLLDALLASRIRLVDYECVRSLETNERLIAFGEMAGKAGMIDALRGLGTRLLGLNISTPFLNVAPAYTYPSLTEALSALRKVGRAYKAGGGSQAFLPPGSKPMVVVFTGAGKVSRGAQSVLEALDPVVLPSIASLTSQATDPCQIYSLVVREADVCRNASGGFSKTEYLSEPHKYNADLFASAVLPHATVVLTGAYWDSRFPRWMPSATFRSQQLLVLADAACDITGSVEFLRRTTTIEDPFLYVDSSRAGVPEVSRDAENDISVKLVCGVDILPSELPRDASKHFGDCLLPFCPALASTDPLPEVLQRAVICEQGRLNASYEYIAAMRHERERAQAAMRSREDLAQGKARVIRLSGHLFDSRLINRVLDLVESEKGQFRIVQSRLQQPRGGPGREHRAHTTVLLQVEGPDVEQLLARVEVLVREAPSDAEATMERLGPDYVLDPVQVLKEPASNSVEERPAVRSSSKPRTVIFGAGLVALPAIELLSRDGAPVAVVSASPDELATVRARLPDRAIELVAASVPSPRVETLVVDAHAALSLLPQPLHEHVARACLASRTPLVTASYAASLSAAIQGEFASANVPLLVEMGLDPGLDHLSACAMIRDARPGRVVSFSSLCGGLTSPESLGDNPLAYKLTWSPRGMLSALRNSASFIRKGVEVNVPGERLLSHAKALVLPCVPALALEHYPNRDSTVYIDKYGLTRSELEGFYRGTIRFRGFAQTMRDLAFLVDKDQEAAGAVGGMDWKELVRGHRLSPRARALLEWTDALPAGKVDAEAKSRLDALCALFVSRLSMGKQDKDLVVMVHELEWESGSKRKKRVDSLVMYGQGGRDTAMARTVGVTAAIGAQIVRRAPHGGLHLPTAQWVGDLALPRLAQEGIRFESRRTK